MKPARTPVLLLLAALIATGCGDAFLSKEQRALSDAVKQAVSADPARIDAPDGDGEPPLQLALTNRLPALFDWLLDRGARPGAQDRHGATALHKAVIFDSPDHRAMRALLRHGAVIDARNHAGEAPLHVTALLSRDASVEALLAAGADPKARDGSGSTPLHRAAAPQPTASADSVVRTIHLLVAAGAEPAARDSAGNTPLHMAALVGSTLATRTLLSEGAPADAPLSGGSTALHTASSFGKAAVAELLLGAGADPNRQDSVGLTPLARALRYPAASGSGPVDTREVVAVLKRFGATDPGR